jgi:protein-disulfide isomerase
VLAVVALLAAGLVGWAVYASQTDDDFPVPAPVTADNSGVVDGAGPVTVEIWLDPHCPHCATFEQEAGAQLDRLVADGEITRVMHPVSFLDRASTTGYSTRASASVGCAADAGLHPPYVRALLARQPPSGGAGLSDEQLIEVAGSVGIAGAGFGDCVTSGRYRDWTAHVTARAAQEGVTATPTVRVDGADVPATVEAVRDAVRAAGGGL